ncbi:MAG: hypothetical protein GY835_16765 [bacterium]|nr:hypothetical protein [bacterium]
MRNDSHTPNPGKPHPQGFILGDDWLVQPDLNRICRGDDEQRIPDKFMQVLVFLVENPGVVSRRELMDAVWPDSIVVEESLTRAISELRKVFGDDPRRPTYIETIPKKGYQILAEIRPPDLTPDPEPMPESRIAPPVQAEPEPPVAQDSPRNMAPPQHPPQATSTVHVSPTPRPTHTTRLTRLFGLLGFGIAAVAIVFLLIKGLRPESPPVISPTIPTSLLLTSFPGTEEFPALSPAGDRLSFVWDSGNGQDQAVYVKVIGAEQALRITHIDGFYFFPAWSHDSRHIAFCRIAGDDSGIFMVPATGGNERKLVDPILDQVPLTPSFSPDGKRLAFTAPTRRSGAHAIFLMSLATKEVTRLTTPEKSSHFDSRPCFSPDGSRIAFVRSRDDGLSIATIPTKGGIVKIFKVGDRLIGDIAWGYEPDKLIFTASDGLWELPLDGGAPNLISASKTSLTYLAMARDANILAFTESNEEKNIWEYAPSDSSTASSEHMLIASSRFDASASYSNDGTRIAFVSERSGEPQIWIAESDGSHARQMTQFTGVWVHNPFWAPNDSLLAFSNHVGGNRRICLLDLFTEELTILTPPGDHEDITSWSADGQWIYFRSHVTGESQIWKRSIIGGDARQITFNGGNQAQESPDGRLLYYSSSNANGNLWSMPSTGGESEQVIDLEGEQLLDWDISSEGIFYCHKESVKAQEYTLDFHSFDSGKKMPVLTTTSHDDFSIDVHPDGMRILFGRTARQESDILGIENF